MADLIILKVPEDISVRARQIAATVAQPVEQLLLDHLKTLAAPLPVLPPDTQVELDALQRLSDDGPAEKEGTHVHTKGLPVLEPALSCLKWEAS